MNRTLAIIPARAGSKRLPGKNVRTLLGKPLIAWTIEFARSLDRFDEVMVSTDGEEIAAAARAAGANVPWLRPPGLASDTATSVDVVMHALAEFSARGASFEYVALLQPTTPIRVAARWHRAFAELDAGAVAAIGVRIAPVHPYWSYRLAESGEMTAFFPEAVATRSQDLPRACVPNGALYLARTSALHEHRSLVPPGAKGIVCEAELESIDIDTLDDWDEAERLMRVRAGEGA